MSSNRSPTNPTIEQARSPEGVLPQDIEALLDDSEQAELRSLINQFGYDYERYSDLLYSPESKTALLELAERLKTYAEQNRSVVSDIQVINLCLDLSQAYINASGGRSISEYSPITEGDLQELHSAFKSVIESVDTDSALVSISRQSVLKIFTLYEECSNLEVDVPYRNYETDMLGGVIHLGKDAVPRSAVGLGDLEPTTEANPALARERAAMETYYDRAKLLDVHPVHLARGLVGFRDVSERVSLVASVDQTKLTAAPSYTYEAYSDLDWDMRDYLSSSDYELVVSNASRAFTVQETQSIGSATNLDKDELVLLQELHRPLIRGDIESKLGINLGDITLENQYHLLDYLSTRNQDDFERLSSRMRELPVRMREQMFESFLALEFGTDFGDILLNIGESSDAETLDSLFSGINRFKETSEAFSRMFPDEIQGSVSKAMSERLTELLYVAQEVSANGHAEADILDRLPIKVSSLEELIEDINTLESCIQKIVETAYRGSAKRTVNQSDNFNLYRLTDDSGDVASQMLLYVRSEGAGGYDRDIEYGRPSEGVEASISFIVSPYGDEYLSPYKKERAQNEISIRLDREGTDPDGPRHSVDRNPMTENGTISLDIGSILGRDDSFGTRIGRIIALGNQLRSQDLGSDTSLNHNSSTFDQAKFGTSAGFAKLAEQIDQMARSRLQKYNRTPFLRFAACPPQQSDSE